MAQGVHFTREGVTFEDPKRYGRLVRKLNYLTVTRLNIAYSVSVVSQYMSAPTVDHWVVVEQILCYLKGALGRGILYSNHKYNRIECFINADWVGSMPLVCSEKSKGGIGLKSFSKLNKALLSKWSWRFANDINALWRKAICCKFCEAIGGWHTRDIRGSYGTSLWKEIGKE